MSRPHRSVRARPRQAALASAQAALGSAQAALASAQAALAAVVATALAMAVATACSPGTAGPDASSADAGPGDGPVDRQLIVDALAGDTADVRGPDADGGLPGDALPADAPLAPR